MPRIMGVRRGFTLIELLVVIAIIGMLAAMVFPVFARARESARKAVCLSNVKNIALAMQMYLADNNDTFPPEEHRQEVNDYFFANPGGGSRWGAAAGRDNCAAMANNANPYLRFALILDGYIRNREVWRCPSAKTETGPQFINPAVPDWLTYLKANEGEWGAGRPLCPSNCFPPGWGGQVTDSILQGTIAYVGAGGDPWRGHSGSARATFIQSIGINGRRELKLASVGDAANFVFCADQGSYLEAMCNASLVAYPDLCNVPCGNCGCSSWIEGCADSIRAGCPEVWTCFETLHTASWMLKDKNLLKKGTRHLGGVNIGFLDGHASWMNSDRFLDKWAEEARPTGQAAVQAMGVCFWGPVSWCSGENTGGQPFSVAFPDEPTLR